MEFVRLIFFIKPISEADLDVPMFDGESYMSAPIPTTKSIRHVTSFSLEIKTTASDGMLIWIGEVKYWAVSDWALTRAVLLPTHPTPPQRSRLDIFVQ